ncbi:MAG: DNA-processing protein DprA [Candidatus Omnitrophica bacterium]|nr:DNA-processing protein DprA [Candidatus Omnitrophota bacterium]
MGEIILTDSISIDSPQYPQLLKSIPDAPKKLYYKGDWDENIFSHCLAVVGARRMTRYGKQVTDLLVSELAAVGITIVSGFMYGIDAAAHQAAVSIQGRTIACMPCGIDIIHPAYQKNLYEQILENHGLIISEYEGDFPPALWTYPRRNRIVAGLSAATMVVEAGLASGSLITAKLAAKFGRKLFAVPGMLTSALSKGPMRLIKQGAEIVTSANDVMDFYKISVQGLAEEDFLINSSSSLQQRILRELKHEPMDMDILSYKLRISIPQLSTEISLLQLKGIIIEQAGKYNLNIKRQINVS